MENFTIGSDKKEVSEKVFAAFENETLRELGEKVVGGIWFEASWGSGKKPTQPAPPASLA